MIRPQYQKSIEERIKESDYGAVYTASDFLDIASVPVVNEAMYRLVQDGQLRRIINGVYYKPKYSELLGEFVMPRIDLIAEALARKFNWTIAPAGNTALNALHLSTQVPNIWTYVSDGPYRKYQIGQTELEFKSVKNRDIAGKHRITVMVIQALKTLGKDGVTQDIIAKLKGTLSSEDKAIILNEAQTSTSWIFEFIREICREEENA